MTNSPRWFQLPWPRLPDSGEGREWKRALWQRIRWIVDPSKILSVLALIALAACGASPSVESRRTAEAPKRPLIIIPGMLGSRLVSAESGRTAWGARLDLLLGGSGLSHLALPVSSLDFHENRDDLVPAGIIKDILVQDYYGELVATLETSGGYTCVSPGEIGPSTDCVLFAWDWRRDLVEAAGHLDRTIEALRAARSDFDLQADIVAHSAGGLVARYFIRYGSADVLEEDLPPAPPLTGAAKVRNALLIAPPNYGSIYGLQRVMRGADVGLSKLKPEVTATMPSTYQLLPHPDRQWMIDLQGNPVSIDLFDVETWREFREGIFHPEAGASIEDDPDLVRFFVHALERGRRFQRALSTPVTALPTRYVLFGASCKDTPAICLLGWEDGRPTIRLSYRTAKNRLPGVDYRKLMLAPGDGRVTLESLTGRTEIDRPEDRPFPFEAIYLGCEDHSKLASHPGLISAMLSILDP